MGLGTLVAGVGSATKRAMKPVRAAASQLRAGIASASNSVKARATQARDWIAHTWARYRARVLRRGRRLRRRLVVFFRRLPRRLGLLWAGTLNRSLKARLALGQRLRRHNSSVLVVSIVALIGVSFWKASDIQTLIEPGFNNDMLSSLRSLLVGVGGALVGATAIVFSVVMLAVQLNFARTPHALFQKLSSDFRLLAYFAATFLLGLIVGSMAVVVSPSALAVSILVGAWCAVVALLLFLAAYRRALYLVSPHNQLLMILRRASRSMRVWDRRATRSAPLIERRSTRGTRDMARAMFFKLNPLWERDAREAVTHALSFARRYSEQGEHDVSAIALTTLVRVNGEYVKARGRTFFPSNIFFDNPLSGEGFISDTLEHLRILSLIAQARGDEEQFNQILATLARLSETYTAIDYGDDLGFGLLQPELAASYLTRAVEGATRSFGPDVLLGGMRQMGDCAASLVRTGRALSALSTTDSMPAIAMVGLAKRDFGPVTAGAVRQLARIAIDLFGSKEFNLHHTFAEVRSSIDLIAFAVLASPDGVAQQHRIHLAPYYSLAEYGNFGDALRNLVNAIAERPAGDNDAERIIEHLQEWSDGIYQSQRKLLQAAVEKRSSLTLTLIMWICFVVKVLVVASKAPAAREHTSDELVKDAIWLLWGLDWMPGDKESVQFLESQQPIEHLFDLTIDMIGREVEEVAEAGREILLNWTFKAAIHQSGWATLESGLIALALSAAWRADPNWSDWLETKVAEKLAAGAGIPDEERAKAAEGLQEAAISRGRGEFAIRTVDVALTHVNRQRFRAVVDRLVTLLTPPDASKRTLDN